jgi:UDP-N-acetylglucosamine 3-dehydrogenase
MITRPPVNIVLIGGGAMGRNHARVLRQSRDCYLVGIVEANPERGAALAEELEVPTWTSLSDCTVPVDAAVIATPTLTHEPLVHASFERGLDVLVEKPIAHDLPSAARMVYRAEEDNRLLMVGQIERFNGAVMALPQYLDDPIHFNCQRVGPYDPRILDGIILDLMIHDLDIVHHLTRLPAVPMGAVAVSTHGRSEDHATASVMFGDRISASFIASRVGQNKVRTLEISQPHNSISVDLIRQDITIHTVESVDYSGPGNALRQRGLVEIPFIERSGQPLAAELSHFAACVRGEAECIAPGEDGLAALSMVRSIELLAATIKR